MNSYVGDDRGSWNSKQYREHVKASDIAEPTGIFVILDEREDSIDDAYFAVNVVLPGWRQDLWRLEQRSNVSWQRFSRNAGWLPSCHHGKLIPVSTEQVTDSE